jgi:hypothetical protein
MMSFRRNSEAVQRAAERRRREDSAPRLSTEVPTLESLRLEVEEWRADGHAPDSKHIRRVVVGSAPALFLIACGDSRCKDGGHDLTSDVMRHLRAGEHDFEGQSVCHGQTGTATCGRILRYRAVADHRKQ